MWFSHPKPFITRAVAVQMVERKALPPPVTTLIVAHQDPSTPELRRQASTAADIAVPIGITPASGQ